MKRQIILSYFQREKRRITPFKQTFLSLTVARINLFFTKLNKNYSNFRLLEFILDDKDRIIKKIIHFDTINLPTS